MKSVGEILKSAREKKKLTLSQLSVQTSISQDFLKAIENDAFDQLPNDVSARGFLSLYATSVGMDPKTITALYRRDIQVPDQYNASLHTRFFVFGHERLFRFALSAILAGVAISVAVFVILFWFRLRQAPPLLVSTPQNESHAISPLFVRGVTSSDAVVQIDGDAIGVNQDGVFTKDLDLDPGLHVLTIKAIGRNGKERVDQIVVTIDSTQKE